MNNKTIAIRPEHSLRNTTGTPAVPIKTIVNSQDPSSTDIISSLKDRIAKNVPTTICFVCYANRNRSAISAILLRHHLWKLGRTKIWVISAGTEVYCSGAPKDSLSRDYKKILPKLKISYLAYLGFKSQQFKRSHTTADYVIAASEEIKNNLLMLYKDLKGKIVIMTEMHEELQKNEYNNELPDPQKKQITKEGLVHLINNTIIKTLIDGLAAEKSGDFLSRISDYSRFFSNRVK